MTINNSGAGIQLVNAVTVATTLTMTRGNIDLNGNNLTLGISAASIGTLARTAGTMLGTGSFIRWFNTSTIADGSVTGLFPMGTATDYRPFYVSAPVVAPTTGGTIAVAYTNATTNTTVSFPDGLFTVEVRKDLKWSLTTGNGLAGGTYDLDAQGTGFGLIGSVTDLRLTLINSVTGTAGTNAGTTTDPQINRTGVSFTNLSNSFYVGSINSTSTPLPITLISFTASVVGGMVKLDWETSAEMNNNYFTIQRSKDAAAWESISQVAGAGTSDIVSSYTYYDPAPYAGTSYYRLMQTDLDGKQTYSPVRSVNLGNASSAITIYPNPATDQIMIVFPTSGEYEITLLNSNGQTIKAPVFSTGNNLLLNVSNMEAGIYFIRINNGTISETRKVIIRP